MLQFLKRIIWSDSGMKRYAFIFAFYLETAAHICQSTPAWWRISGTKTLFIETRARLVLTSRPHIYFAPSPWANRTQSALGKNMRLHLSPPQNQLKPVCRSADFRMHTANFFVIWGEPNYFVLFLETRTRGVLKKKTARGAPLVVNVGGALLRITSCVMWCKNYFGHLFGQHFGWQSARRERAGQWSIWCVTLAHRSHGDT
jgi:hypothetical protein